MLNTISVIFSEAKEADRALPAAKTSQAEQSTPQTSPPISTKQYSLGLFNALLRKSQIRPSTQLLRSPGWWAGVGISADV
ncbi:hypothetical protein I7I48_05463 [Histoplasma ohiense]|nr:hypothetical protein I7I48_05463 [Histoplasma ohiense (nom. inval.)]